MFQFRIGLCGDIGTKFGVENTFIEMKVQTCSFQNSPLNFDCLPAYQALS